MAPDHGSGSSVGLNVATIPLPRAVRVWLEPGHTDALLVFARLSFGTAPGHAATRGAGAKTLGDVEVRALTLQESTCEKQGRCCCTRG